VSAKSHPRAKWQVRRKIADVDLHDVVNIALIAALSPRLLLVQTVELIDADLDSLPLKLTCGTYFRPQRLTDLPAKRISLRYLRTEPAT